MYRTTMPYADFCCTFKKNRFFSSRVSHDMQQTSRGKFDRLQRTTAGFTDTRLDGYGLCCSLPTRPRVQASYPILVHRHTPLLHASFRPRLATTPLRFANPSPPSGWIRDLHPSNCRTCTAHNDEEWKGWKAIKPASHPSHSSWTSLRDSHIPTASTTGSIFQKDSARGL